MGNKQKRNSNNKLGKNQQIGRQLNIIYRCWRNIGLNILINVRKLNFNPVNK
jgi:hypothetical protein